MKKNKGTKLNVHILLRNPIVQRILAFYISKHTIISMLFENSKPSSKTMNQIVLGLKENFEEYKSIADIDLCKKLYDRAQ